jgi:serine/threonine protein kinase
MANDSEDLSAREQLLDEVLVGYLAAVDAGQRPDRRELAARHPELAAELDEYFLEQDKLERWAEPLRSASQAACLDDMATGLDADGSGDLGPRPAPSAPDHYELLEPIARGGMGVVWKAKDRRLNRLVALKMLAADEGLSPDEAQRFRNEAEAAALLDHPHIVPIYEVGEHRGQAYLSMKLLDGGSLDGQLSRFVAAPREAARLLVPLARAIHHAHQRGVLHRDLKPGNVLLDGDGRPYVSDFGLAKRLGAGALDLTQPGAVVGTPPYMAPEQATGRKGAVTTATDVYGLGALLYTLLTGRPPFRGDGVLETLEQVCGRPPEPPRKINPAIERDLELICLKCLEKEPHRRYASALALADELQRYLDGKPLSQTRPVGRPERLWRWCRRNPRLAALTAAVALCLVSVAVVSSAAYFRVKAAGEQEHASRVRAEENLGVARDAVAYFTRISEDPRLRAVGLERLRRDMWGKARDFYAQLARQQADDPRVEADRGRAFLQLGRLMDLLGSPAEALDSYRQAEEVFERLANDHPGVADYEDGLAQALLEQGNLHQLARQYPQARGALDGALPIRRRLAREHPDVSAYQQGLARAYHQLARLYQVTDQTEQARDTYEEALRTFGHMAEEHPDQPIYRELRARTHLNLGTAYVNAKHSSVEQTVAHYREAETNYAAARDLLDGLDRQHPGTAPYRSLLAEVHHLLGSLYRRGGRPDKALPAYEKSLAILGPLAGDHPDVPEYRFLLGSVRHAEGYAHLLLHRLDQARASYEKAAGVTDPLADHYDVAHYREEKGKLAYDRACLDGLSAAAVTKDTKLEPREREKRIEQYGHDAVEQLRKAWPVWLKDFKNPDPITQLNKEKDFDSLRTREDFRKLLTDFAEELRARR